MLSVVFFAISLASFASFFSSVFLVFHTPAGQTSRLLLVMKIASVATWTIALTTIARSPATYLITATTALCGQLASLALFWFAAHEAIKHRLTIAFTPAAPSSLISAGPFRWLLHPFYSAYVLSYWSVFMFTSNWGTGCAAAFMHILYTVSAAREERLLSETFEYEYVIAKRHRLSLFPVFGKSICMAAVVVSILLVLAIALRLMPKNGTFVSDAALEAALKSAIFGAH